MIYLIFLLSLSVCAINIWSSVPLRNGFLHTLRRSGKKSLGTGTALRFYCLASIIGLHYIISLPSLPVEEKKKKEMTNN